MVLEYSSYLWWNYSISSPTKFDTPEWHHESKGKRLVHSYWALSNENHLVRTLKIPIALLTASSNLAICFPTLETLSFYWFSFPSIPYLCAHLVEAPCWPGHRSSWSSELERKILGISNKVVWRAMNGRIWYKSQGAFLADLVRRRSLGYYRTNE